MKHRDFLYELFRAAYQNGFGDFDRRFDQFAKENPELIDRALSVDELKQGIIKRLKAEHRAADREDDGEYPVSRPHLRQAFLDFGYGELPPLMASIETPTGRKAAEQCTAEEQRDAVAAILSSLLRCVAYRRRSLKDWDALLVRMSAEHRRQIFEVLLSVLS